MYDRSSLWRAAAALQTSLRTKTPRKVEMMKTNVPRPRALVQQNEKPLEAAVNAGKGKENQNLRLQLEMLTFLSSYAEQREENEREKMELMKEAKEERKSFFNQLLQIMSKRK